MSAFKGTPGRWLAGDNFVYALNADGVNRFFCGIQPGWITKGIKYRTPDSELAANTRLIAAAPELLEALRYAIEQVPELATVPGIASAIAKAIGEQA